LLVSQVNSCSIDQESGEVGQAGKPHSGGSQICAVQANSPGHTTRGQVQ